MIPTATSPGPPPDGGFSPLAGRGETAGGPHHIDNSTNVTVNAPGETPKEIGQRVYQETTRAQRGSAPVMTPIPGAG
jgi:hypothetical protein